MQKKYIFIDLDGTLIDHDKNQISKMTRKTIKDAQDNGHEIILSTGRPKALFYGVDEELNITSYIANNGRVVVYNSTVIYEFPIPQTLIEELVEYASKNNIDLAYEGHEVFALESRYNELYKQFSDRFHIEIPTYIPGFYKDNRVYQILMYYDKPDFKRFEVLFPRLSFNYSCEYGLDVNMGQGLKEVGLIKIVNYLGINIEDTIAVGDGFNDISMIRQAHIGVAMGNAPKEVKRHADYVAKTVEQEGIYHIFKQLGLI
ncbi:MAG: HAD family hydrolase [Candidatus Izimaplasma sp.]|nr:HAD family hydrolase [Candidatus Izimaplasma bacterium]